MSNGHVIQDRELTLVVNRDWCRVGLKPVEIEGRADFATTFNFRSTLRWSEILGHKWQYQSRLIGLVLNYTVALALAASLTHNYLLAVVQWHLNLDIHVALPGDAKKATLSSSKLIRIFKHRLFRQIHLTCVASIIKEVLPFEYVSFVYIQRNLIWPVLSYLLWSIQSKINHSYYLDVVQSLTSGTIQNITSPAFKQINYSINIH